MGKLSAIKEALEQAGKRLDDYSRFAADANKMDRALNQMGFKTIRDSSRVSGSEYLIARTPDYMENEVGDVISGREFKLRVSDHALPEKYDPADIDVITSRDEFRGDAIGGWADAIKYISEKTGIQPKGAALRQVNELNRLAAERAAIEAAQRQQANALLETKKTEWDRLREWAQNIPDGSKLSVSGKGKIRAITPEGQELLYGQKPHGFSSHIDSKEKLFKGGYGQIGAAEPRLLAGIAAGTSLAALGLSPDETQAAINNYMRMTQASNPIMQNLENNLRPVGMSERGIPVTGTMQATPFPGLQAVADAVRVPQAPGIGPLFGGLSDYMGKVAQGQDVTWWDRVGASLDVMP